jgi:homoserine dehydrogenase
LRTINLGLIGFGIVGSGVVKILQENASLIRERVGAVLNLKRIADTADTEGSWNRYRDRTHRRI